MRSTSLTVGPCRISYPDLFTAKESKKFPQQGKRFKCDILIPKDSPLVQAIMEKVQLAKNEGLEKIWNGKEPKNLKMPLSDGDERDDQNYHGHYVLSPWSKEDRPPKIVDMNRVSIIDQSEIYGGVWANVNVNFYAYDNSGAGIGCGFDAGVQKVKDDTPFGGGNTSLEEAFGGPVDSNIDPLTGQPRVAINPLTGKPYEK